MSNIRYAVLIIGALSLLLGLSLGQIYFQHQRIEQLEFNRFRSSVNVPQAAPHTCHPRNRCTHDLSRFFDGHRESMERARVEAFRKRQREMTIQVDEVEKRLQKAIRRYNKEVELWESNHTWKSTKNGLYRFED
ncbi:hypothetical protein [Flavilitoribacter nigricans]|uniref:Uncharacterized protein n=1 Tax=Flavilitoribacter nigricans (strain ATCC 23147 / DSM 23189 / NBRC 102662 / NCIMB 1420 / SS-2) TaxID=1122177 RepID=A0A2D0NB94_FLAN2|nr:hypothetical protein [Flavilitoribacter nigricans]PHN05781.1 hypothetical protein CRP01_15010 [Flavilitoribacter nigricans DSM 23189 = NBRC 102662]